MLPRTRKTLLSIGQLAIGLLIAHGITHFPSPNRLLSQDIIKKHHSGKYSWITYEQNQLEPEQLMGWINNDTVLVVGYRKSDGNGLYAWKPGSRPRMILKDGYRFCHDGKNWTALTATTRPGDTRKAYIRHRINPASLSISRIGTLATARHPSSDSIYTCNEESRPASLDNHNWKRLRPNDGFLDLGPTSANDQKASLIRPDMATRVNTPMRFDNPWNITTEYDEHAGAYLIYDLKISDKTLTRWRATNQLPIWVMKPDGSAKPITIPAGPWAAGRSVDRSFALSHMGMLASAAGLTKENIHNAGIYLLQDHNSFTRLFGGSSQLLSVSPNGCRAAWAVTRPQLLSTGSYTHIAAADLCKSDSRNLGKTARHGDQ